jgi:hypothetical protein
MDDISLCAASWVAFNDELLAFGYGRDVRKYALTLSQEPRWLGLGGPAHKGLLLKLSNYFTCQENNSISIVEPNRTGVGRSGKIQT